MSVPDRLPPEVLDGLLDGSASSEAAGTPLAACLRAIRDEAAGTRPVPSDELRMVLAEGLDPSTLGSPEATATSGRVLVGWRGRGRLVARVLVTKFAALGLVTKMAAAGAAVTLAASGAGAAGVLPLPAQNTFDEVVGREAPAENILEEDTDGGADVDETSPATSADTSTRPPLETDVPGDATGTSDGEPGVDGGEVADDASDGRRAPTQDAPREAPAGERTDDTPAADVVDGSAASDPPAERQQPPREDGAVDQQDRAAPPAQSAERQRTAPEQAEQDAGEQRPEDPPSEQSESDQRPSRS